MQFLPHDTVYIPNLGTLSIYNRFNDSGKKSLNVIAIVNRGTYGCMYHGCGGSSSAHLVQVIVARLTYLLTYFFTCSEVSSWSKVTSRPHTIASKETYQGSTAVNIFLSYL